MNRVAITGLAPITAMGTGKAFFEHLLKKEAVIRRIPPEYTGAPLSTGWYVPFPEVDYKPFGRDFLRMSAMTSRNACTGAAAALLALKDAGLEQPDPDTAVFFGVGAPHSQEVVKGYRSVTEHKPMHPCTNPMIMTNSVPAWISILLGIHGVSQVVSTACASGTSAIGEAYLHIRSGRGSMAICGGADDLACDEGMMLRSFDVLGALTKAEDGIPRAFSQERSGFLFSEGATCALILEEYASARKRGARIYAEITGYAATCDAYHIVQMPPVPTQIIRMLEQLTVGEQIDYYNAHGTGTPVNDRTEQLALTETFGERAASIPVTSVKGILGHTIGASGAIEAAVCAYSLHNQVIHGNLLGTPLPGLCLPEESREVSIRTAISASFGFGGHNAALKFRREEPA